MGLRSTNRNKVARLSIKKETLRQLQLRTLSEDDLRAAAGGRSACCSLECPPAPSYSSC